MIYAALGTAVNTVVTTTVGHTRFRDGLTPTFLPNATRADRVHWHATWHLIILSIFYQRMPQEQGNSTFVDGANESTAGCQAPVAAIILVTHRNSPFKP